MTNKSYGSWAEVEDEIMCASNDEGKLNDLLTGFDNKIEENNINVYSLAPITVNYNVIQPKPFSMFDKFPVTGSKSIPKLFLIPYAWNFLWGSSLNFLSYSTTVPS